MHNEVVQCLICQSVKDTKLEKFENYVKKEHAEHENVTYDLYFGDMLLTVGAGHMVKNLLLTIFRFCRNLFVEAIACKLGFWSKKAIEFIVNCGNHHISWQICSIAYEAFSEELLYIYVKDCLERNIEPDPNHLRFGVGIIQKSKTTIIIFIMK